MRRLAGGVVRHGAWTERVIIAGVVAGAGELDWLVLLFLFALAIGGGLGRSTVDVADDGDGAHALDGELEVSL